MLLEELLLDLLGASHTLSKQVGMSYQAVHPEKLFLETVKKPFIPTGEEINTFCQCLRTWMLPFILMIWRSFDFS